MVYDERIMRFKGVLTVSLLTLHGRVLVHFRVGRYQQSRLDAIKGQADLLYLSRSVVDLYPIGVSCHKRER
jgi:putative transposase